MTCPKKAWRHRQYLHSLRSFHSLADLQDFDLVPQTSGRKGSSRDPQLRNVGSVRKPGRPPVALLDRIRAKIAGRPDIAAELASYPARIEACWIWEGNAELMVRQSDGRPKKVVRALVEYACGEQLSDGYVLKCQCFEKRCVNPTHYAPVVHNMNFYGTPPALPAKLRHEQQTDVVEELIGLIQSQEPRRTQSEFKAWAASAGIEYSDTQISAAYARVT